MESFHLGPLPSNGLLLLLERFVLRGELLPFSLELFLLRATLFVELLLLCAKFRFKLLRFGPLIG